MGYLSAFAGRTLTWEPTAKGQKVYALRDGDRELATLTQAGQWGQRRTAVTPEGTWTFSRAGFWGARVSITDAGGAEIASVRSTSWTGRRALLIGDPAAPAATYRWRRKGMMGSEFFWTDAADHPLLHFSMAGMMRARGTLTIAPEAAALPYLTLLAVVGWHLVLRQRSDDEAATVAATTVVTTS